MSSIYFQEKPNENEGRPKRTAYEPPSVIYSGQITTRAGSPLGDGSAIGVDEIDPNDLFNN